MITIIKIVGWLVAINFLLLFFSINKKPDRSKHAYYEKPKRKMYKIEIIGKAQTDYSHLNELDGISAHDDFVEYIDDDLDGNLKSGYLQFRFEDPDLLSVTTYTSKRELTLEELEDLIKYTQGQWSDGIGEGFEQQPCYYGKDGEEEVYISPWYHGQTAVAIQKKVEE